MLNSVLRFSRPGIIQNKQIFTSMIFTNQKCLHNLEKFHIPITVEDRNKMLKIVKSKSQKKFLKDATSFKPLMKNYDMKLNINMSEVIGQVNHLLSKNVTKNCFIGQGFYYSQIPPIVKRCLFENPLWYTAYTPYQAEISQGRLEAIFNYQIMVKRITEMEVANACLLDEASAAAEAVLMAYRIHNNKRHVLFVEKSVFPSTKSSVINTTKEVGITVIEIDSLTKELIMEHNTNLIGFIGQSPDLYGYLKDFTQEAQLLHNVGALLIVGTDLLSCTIAKPPGEMDADIAYGNGQRFGTPVGFGGPHAAFFATKTNHIRKMPGRIISAAKDVHGNIAFRMALQTREQHIRREMATSNICTSQVLLANMNFFYALYHGEEGLLELANKIHHVTKTFALYLKQKGVKIVQHEHSMNVGYFNTVSIEIASASQLSEYLHNHGFYVNQIDATHISISFDELNLKISHQLVRHILNYHLSNSTQSKMEETVKVATQNYKQLLKNHEFEKKEKRETKDSKNEHSLDAHLARNNAQIFLEKDIFSKIKGEHEILRYITKLQNKDITLCNSMIPLGSCTMKLNSAWELETVSNPKLDVHPYSPETNIKGYIDVLKKLSIDLCEITGLDAVTYQSNSGAMGEYVGLKTIKLYHQSQGHHNKNVVLIPASAHGTNPASASKIGLHVVVVKVDKKGYVDFDDLKEKINENRNNLFGLMLTFPSTHGVYEENTGQVIELIHQAGGQVYIDGANMNAQLGTTSPGKIGGDVCHLNLHKTFSIPHGGGGPGMGPVFVKKHLQEFLPQHDKMTNTNFTSTGERIEGKGDLILSSPFGSASILLISYLYIRGMGLGGIMNCGFQSILSANYLVEKLKEHYPILYTNQTGKVAHEFILDIRPIKEKTGISEEDIAKRLMDYNFHAPTMSFPVPGTLMIEPTESESLAELDRFIEALIQIKHEINKVADGSFDKLDNPLKNAPHTIGVISANEWNHKYTREEAAYPLPWLRTIGKIYPGVGRINNVNAEKNLLFEYPIN